MTTLVHQRTRLVLSRVAVSLAVLHEYTFVDYLRALGVQARKPLTGVRGNEGVIGE